MPQENDIMAIQTVAHIANVSFKDHFLGLNGDAPVNGKITVNDNTFDVNGVPISFLYDQYRAFVTFRPPSV